MPETTDSKTNLEKPIIIKKKPWNWLATTGLIFVIFHSASPTTTQSTDPQVYIVGGFIILAIGFILSIIGIIKGRHKQRRGNWTGYLGIILTLGKLLIIFVAISALNSARG